MAEMKRMVGKTKKKSNGSNTKPFNVQLIKPAEIIKDKPAAKKTTGVRPTKEAVKKAKALTGPAAVEAMKKRVSPAGVKKAEAGAKKAIDKKYPGLYKKSK